jgi:tetratricopeptide (TPR) repeat protein
MTAVTCEQILLNFMNTYQRFTIYLAIILLVSLSAILSACGGPVPTESEIKKDIKDGRTEQTIRVANATRAGGDLRSSLSLYIRAHRMQPKWPEPLLQLGATHYALGEYEESSKAYLKATAVAPKKHQSP